MHLQISETARLSGVSVRTLHYYDQIGLLHPAEVTESGYRFYGDEELRALQQILFYRELGFPLREIAAIRSAPHYDARQAMTRQRELLLLQRRRLDRLVAVLDENLKGEGTMDFSGFDVSEIEKTKAAYAEEAQQRWGDTAAWQQSQAHEKARTPRQQEALQQEMNACFRRFAALRAGDPAAPAAQAAVAEWQAFLNANYYTCTREILAGLGEMYAADKRFQRNLDQFGAGTASFLSAAIAIYCGK